jgi:hypothetical protein
VRPFVVPGTGTTTAIAAQPVANGDVVFATNIALDFGGDATYDCVAGSGQNRHAVQWCAIPKSNGTTDYPNYRTLVNFLMTAYLLNKSFIMYVDGCTGSYPKVVGMQIW